VVLTLLVSFICFFLQGDLAIDGRSPPPPPPPIIYLNFSRMRNARVTKYFTKNSYKVMSFNMIECLKIWIHLLLNHVVPHHFVKVFFL
jgi:hypothetical protein